MIVSRSRIEYAGWELGGFQVWFDTRMVDHKQFRFPRSKKRRIRRKWQRDWKNWRDVPKKGAYQIGCNAIVMHPAIWEQVKAKFAKG